MADGFTVDWRVEANDLPRLTGRLKVVADQVVAKAALDLEAQAKSRAPVDTGFLKGSIQARKVRDGQWEVTVGADYGLYVEYGTVHTRAQPFLGPAVDVVRPAFIQAMRTVVSRA